MFLLAVLSFVQIVFLPGFLLLYKFKLGGNILRTIIFSFGASLIINYIFIVLLTALGIYNRYAVSGILLLEIIIFVILKFSSLKKWLFTPSVQSVKIWTNDRIHALKAYFDTFHAESQSEVDAKYLNVIFMSFALAGIVAILGKSIDNIGTIFNAWDAVISWNRWALDWYRNTLPVQTWHYPQLVPANWSISYVLMDMPLQFIPKMIMPLFMISILGSMFDLGLHKRSFGLFIGILITLALYGRLFNMTDGYMDIPVSFFSLASVYCLLLAPDERNDKAVYKYILLGAFFAAGAAVTKQAGLFIVMLYPVLTYILVITDRTDFEIKDVVGLLLRYIGIVFIVVAPFYIYTEIRIRLGLEQSEVNWVTNEIYGGNGAFKRAGTAIKIFASQVHGLYLLLLLISLFSLRDKSYRWIVGLIVVPYLGIWAFFFSYDFRNIALALPFLSMAIGFGIERLLLTHGRLLLSRIMTIKNIALLVLVIAILIIASFRMSAGYLQNRHISLEKRIGNPALNHLIYQHSKNGTFPKKVLSNYEYLRYLPGLKGILISQHFSPSDTTEYQRYGENISNPEIGYILIPEYSNARVVNDIRQRILAGKLKLIFQAEGYIFAEII